MKKLASLLLAFCFVFIFTGCGEDENYPSVTPVPDENSRSEEELPVPAALKLGIGIVSDRKGSLSPEGNEPGRARTSTVVCAVAVDNEGIIRKVKFDSVRSDIPFDTKGAFTEDMTLPLLSMREMGFDVGMAEASGTKNEWFQQMDIFENWMLGKKTSDILNMELDENFVPTSPELAGKIDIGVSDYLTALNKAYTNAA